MKIVSDTKGNHGKGINSELFSSFFIGGRQNLFIKKTTPSCITSACLLVITTKGDYQMKKIYCQIGMLGVLLAFALPAFSQSNVACPVETPYEDAGGNPVTFQDKFGYDVLEKMQCNKRRSNVKMVMQVNAFEVGPENNRRPYGFRNLPNIIKDFEMTHGIENWRIAIVIHSGGFPFVEKGNDYEDLVKSYAKHPNVDIYYCLNTAAARGHKTEDIVEGVKFVPAGLSSIMDLQYQGYKYIQP